jgi:rod shape-determining protein MreD
MRRAIIILGSILIIYISFFLQVNLFNNIPLFGVIPNLSIIFIVSIGLMCGIIPGVLTGLLYGIVSDVIFGKAIGVYILIYILTGLFTGYISNGFSKDNKIAIIVMVFIVSIIAEMSIYMLSAIIYKMDFEFLKALLISTIEATYNILISVLLYRFIVGFCEFINKYKNKYLL